MKKNLLIICAICLFAAGCTKPEQDAKIKMFWLEQYMNLMAKLTAAQTKLDVHSSQDISNKLHEALQNLHTQTPDKPQPAAASSAAPKPRPAAKKLPEMLEVTLDEEALPGKAPLQERILMKKAWNEAQLDNHDFLQDLQDMFGEDVKVKAFLITSQTETALKKEAAKAPSYQAYLVQHKKLVQAQTAALQQLMQENKKSIKHIKTAY